MRNLKEHTSTQSLNIISVMSLYSTKPLEDLNAHYLKANGKLNSLKTALT